MPSTLPTSSAITIRLGRRARARIAEYGLRASDIKQQVLAEALFELAAYIDIKADFYDTRFNLTEQFNKLVRHQSILADRQQASRDLILRAHQNSKDAIVVQVHVCMLDLYELVLSTHTDYAQLRTHLADSPIMVTLHDLAYKCARDIESVAYDVTRKKASFAEITYEPELAAIEAELAAIQQRIDAGKPQQEALAVLRLMEQHCALSLTQVERALRIGHGRCNGGQFGKRRLHARLPVQCGVIWTRRAILSIKFIPASFDDCKHA